MWSQSHIQYARFVIIVATNQLIRCQSMLLSNHPQTFSITSTAAAVAAFFNYVSSVSLTTDEPTSSDITFAFCLMAPKDLSVYIYRKSAVISYDLELLWRNFFFTSFLYLMFTWLQCPLSANSIYPGDFHLNNNNKRCVYVCVYVKSKSNTETSQVNEEEWDEKKLVVVGEYLRRGG